MKLSHKELVRLSMVYKVSSDPSAANGAWNQLRSNTEKNEWVIDQKWYKEANLLIDHINNSLLWKALNEED